MKKAFATAALLALALCAPAHATVVGWGPNHRGELGAGYRGIDQAPVTSVELGSNVKQVIDTYHTGYALLGNGTVEAWGGNTYGQLGNGSHRESATPVHVGSLTRVTQIAGAGAHGMALLANGTVETWGADIYGQLGNGTTGAGHEKDASDLPIAVPGLSGVVAIAAGGADDAALLSNGTLMAWGENKNGQIGDGTFIEKDVPTPVAGLTGVRSVALGGVASLGGHMLALLQNGTLMVWGDNKAGQLGIGTTANSAVPVPVSGLSAVTAMSAGISHSLALTSSGEVYAWGSSRFGELGVAAPQVCAGYPCSELPLPAMSGASAISAGFGFSEAISAGHVYTWGWNEHRQLGDGAKLNTERPAMLEGLGEVTSISAGEYSSLAMMNGEGPPPAVQVTPGQGSLQVHWMPAGGPARWHLSYRLATRPLVAWSKAIALPSSTSSYTITGLTSKCYEVQVLRADFGRAVLSGTPLP